MNTNFRETHQLVDPLGVLQSTLPVVEAAQYVRLDQDRVEAVADEIAAIHATAAAWEDDLHFRDGTWRTAGWVLALDALNFCFWSQDPDPNRRWRVSYRGQPYDGYWALAAALRRAVDDGRPMWDPSYLADLSAETVADILRPDEPHTPEIPLFADRVAHLNEFGRGLVAAFPTDNPVISFIASCNHSAVRLVQQIVHLAPSFNDVSLFNGAEVRLYKRAQILVADLYGAFGGQGLGAFDDLEALTAFADYKVPQVLRRLGVLVYTDPLARTIERRDLIPADSVEEVEIRAATIWGCELIRRALDRRGTRLRAFEIDWALWLSGQSLPADEQPYHRTLTRFY